MQVEDNRDLLALRGCRNTDLCCSIAGVMRVGLPMRSYLEYPAGSWLQV